MMKIFSLLLSILLICSCSNETTKVSHNYHEIKEHLISFDLSFNQIEEEYYVYYYSERCGHCKDIRDQIIEFYLKKKEILYFVCTDISAEFGEPKELIGINNIDDFSIFGTPFMVHFSHWTIDNYYMGSNEILDCISILNKN